jgi:phosphoribosylformylglycinamidine synthase
MTSGVVGANITLTGETTAALFAESQSRFIVTVPSDKAERFEQLVAATKIGEVTDSKTLQIKNDEQRVILETTQDEIVTAWKGAIPCLLKSKA